MGYAIQVELPEIPQATEVVGCDLEEPFVPTDCGLGVTELGTQIGQMEHGVDVVRLEADGLLKAVEGGQPVTQVPQCQAEIGASVGVVGAECQGPLEGRLGLLDAIHVAQDGPVVAPVDRLGAAVGESLLDDLKGPVVLAAGVVDDAEEVGGPGVVGLVTEDGFVKGGRLADVALLVEFQGLVEAVGHGAV